jgi:hypothetical protein
MLLDDAGGDLAAVAQIDLVVGATDPESDRLICRSAVEILFEAHLWSDCGVQGSKRGASNRRLRAAKSYVQPAKLLVEPRQATCNHWLDLHGMQEAGCLSSGPLGGTRTPGS